MGCFHLESVSLVQAAKVHSLQCKMQALKPSTHMLCREAWLGGRALLADPSPFLLAYLSSSPHSHSVILTVIPEFHCKLPGTAYAVAPAISGRPGPALGCPSGTAHNFVIYFSSRTGCTTLKHTQRLPFADHNVRLAVLASLIKHYAICTRAMSTYMRSHARARTHAHVYTYPCTHMHTYAHTYTTPHR